MTCYFEIFHTFPNIVTEGNAKFFKGGTARRANERHLIRV
jgi:hypothetical protein